MDFEKEPIDFIDKDLFDIEKEPEFEEKSEPLEEPEKELTKSGTRSANDTPTQFFTNINGVYAKDIVGRAEIEELKTLIDAMGNTVPPSGWLDNSKTNIWIDLTDSNNLVYSIKPASGATVDWGDGSAVETSTGAIMNHTYIATGMYVIGISGLTGIASDLLSAGWNRNSSASSSNIPKYNLTSSIKYVEIPSTVTSIGDNAFRLCYYLISVSIPTTVTSIGDNAFRGCHSLISVVIPNSITTIKNSMFYDCYSLASIIIPNSVTKIESSAFCNCCCLASIIIPNSVTTIGDDLLSYCYGLTSAVISDSITTIKSYMFCYCYSLTSVTIPSSVTKIESRAFYACYSLTSVTIPSSVTSISGKAFSDCYNLATITVLATTPPTIASDTLSDASIIQHIYVPAESVETYKAADNWSAYASVIEAIPSE